MKIFYQEEVRKQTDLKEFVLFSNLSNELLSLIDTQLLVLELLFEEEKPQQPYLEDLELYYFANYKQQQSILQQLIPHLVSQYCPDLPSKEMEEKDTIDFPSHYSSLGYSPEGSLLQSAPADAEPGQYFTDYLNNELNDLFNDKVNQTVQGPFLQETINIQEMTDTTAFVDEDSLIGEDLTKEVEKEVEEDVSEKEDEEQFLPCPRKKSERLFIGGEWITRDAFNKRPYYYDIEFKQPVGRKDKDRAFYGLKTGIVKIDGKEIIWKHRNKHYLNLSNQRIIANGKEISRSAFCKRVYQYDDKTIVSFSEKKRADFSKKDITVDGRLITRQARNPLREDLKPKEIPSILEDKFLERPSKRSEYFFAGGEWVNGRAFDKRRYYYDKEYTQEVSLEGKRRVLYNPKTGVIKIDDKEILRKPKKEKCLYSELQPIWVGDKYITRQAFYKRPYSYENGIEATLEEKKRAIGNIETNVVSIDDRPIKWVGKRKRKHQEELLAMQVSSENTVVQQSSNSKGLGFFQKKARQTYSSSPSSLSTENQNKTASPLHQESVESSNELLSLPQADAGVSLLPVDSPGLYSYGNSFFDMDKSDDEEIDQTKSLQPTLWFKR